LLAGVVSALAVAGGAQAGNLLQRTGPMIRLSSLAADQQPALEGGKVEVFVRLNTPSVAAYCANQLKAGNPWPASDAQRAHAAALAAEQEAVGSQLAALGATELSRLRAGDNGLRIKIDAGMLNAIRNIAGVAAVAPVTIHTVDLSRSVPWVGADVAQAAGIDGRGVTIAVIDTGIDYTHANFGGSGDPADYASNDPAVIEPGSFPTAKVIGGFDFAGTSYDASGDLGPDVPSPDPDPLDGNGHGSHVGGIAAGLGVPGEIGAGMAPGASIIALKVFGDEAGSTSLTSDAIEYALDPNGDGDISDHVDVINMSLGSSFGDPAAPSSVAAQNASDLGIIVVASAGNSADVPYVTGSPAVAGDVISVASSLPGGDTTGIAVSGDINDSFESIEGTSPVRIADGSVSGMLMVPSDPANIEGCDPISDDMSGAVALISRGSCTFDLKFINAQDAGAAAIVVYNDGASAGRIAPIVMGGIGSSGEPITIPGVMVSFFAGDQLSGALAGGAALSGTLDASIRVATVFGDTLSGFSSRGPGHGGSTFKPDLTAPGSGIVSTGIGSGTGSLTLSGTSMASPHAAGLAALLRQVNPGVKPTGIKAMMQNSASDAVGEGAVGPAPALARQGTGVINAERAVGLTSYAAPAGLSFGRINPKKPVKEKVSFKLHNLGDQRRTFTVTHVPNQTFPGVEVTCPSSISVDANKSRKGKIQLRMDPALGFFDDGYHSQTEVDGWCVLDDGVDTLRVGYLAVVDPASDMKAEGEGTVIEVKNKRGNVGWAEGFTLAARDGLILDNAPNAFNATGFRTNSFAAFGDLVEFGISTEKPWETLAAYEIDIFVDVDSDGIDDFILVAADFFDDGIPVTAIFPQGAALFDTVADLNDASAVLTFIGPMDSPFGGFGFLPPGDTDFDYAAFFIDLRTNSFDAQFGSVDLASEIVPDTASFGLSPGIEVNLPVTGSGEMLWLFQNNEARKGKGKKQASIITVGPGTGEAGESHK